MLTMAEMRTAPPDEHLIPDLIELSAMHLKPPATVLPEPHLGDDTVTISPAGLEMSRNGPILTSFPTGT